MRKSKSLETKNQLRIQYEYAKKHYGGIATIWKRDFITHEDYLSFMRTYSFYPLPDVPEKFHLAIAYLKNMINNHAELVRKYQSENKQQLTIPMA